MMGVGFAAKNENSPDQKYVLYILSVDLQAKALVFIVDPTYGASYLISPRVLCISLISREEAHLV